ncbi:MAG: Integral rane protein [Nocardioides sp.]|nr:Integral rane protein [Nocardioides sp.]
MFRRSKSESATPAEQTVTKVGGKGRPTPTRREAEAAAKARAKVPRSRKELAQSQRSMRSESSKNVRQAMKDGDERYYPARDRGPVRRFVRDFVDSRFSFIELVIPLLLITMVLGYSGNQTLKQWGNTMLLLTVVIVLGDMFMLRFRLRRELGRRFPDTPTKGLTYYAVSRAMQMKFMRLPKSKVKIGQQLPEDYR